MAGKIVVSTLNDDTGVLATQNGMTGIAKAWVNFNGTGTVAINGSFNVSSITDNGTGDYTVNFTTAMPNANYTITGMCQSDANTGFPYNTYEGLVSIAKGRTSALATTGARITTMYVNGPSYVDATIVCVSVFSS